MTSAPVAFRQFRHQPGFACTVVATLALAIGANMAVFSVVNAVLFRELPFADPGRLVWITSVRSDNPAAPFTLPEFMDYRDRIRTLSGFAAYANWRASLAGGEITEGLQGARMSANAFEVLGLTPVAGRLLRESDDRAGAPRVAVLSYRLWQRRFHGAADSIGSTIRLNNESFVIAGVLPPHFPWPLRDIDVVVPLVPEQDALRYVRNSVNNLLFFGRLNRGVSREQAEAELTAICRSLRQQFPLEYARKQAVRLAALHEALIGSYRQSMLLLFGAVLVVLATALANLVSPVLVRASQRQSELAIRVAIGASRWQLLRQISVESLLLALIGSGLGCALAILATSTVAHWAPSSIPRLNEVRVDGQVLAFAVFLAIGATALLTAAAAGAIVGAKAGGVVLPADSRTVGDRWGGWVRQALVIGEISGAVILLMATTMLLENLIRLQDVQPGFHPESVFQARISVPPTYQSPEDLARFYDRLSERLLRQPGVAGVGVTGVAPLSGLLRAVPFSAEGRADERSKPTVNLRVITPGYLSAIGTRLLDGRSFSESDRPDTPPVALVSSSLVQQYLNGDALGRRLLINDNNTGPRAVEIVGVVENVRQSALETPPAWDLYLPLRQIHRDEVGILRNNQFWMIKTGSAPGAFRSTFLAQLRAVDRDSAIAGAGPMQDYVEAALGPRRFNLGLFAGFSLTGVVLAVLGVYGLVSYNVCQRHREIGLRMAIGATERDIYGMILRQAAWLGLAGMVLGGSVAVMAQPLARQLMQDVGIPLRLEITTTGLLFVLVILAAWLPARRAARTSPTLALRGQ